MGAIEKNEELPVTNVGRKKFIHRDSTIKLSEKNIVT